MAAKLQCAPERTPTVSPPGVLQGGKLCRLRDQTDLKCDQSVQPPTAMNPIPANSFKGTMVSQRSAADPKITAMAVDPTRAKAAAVKVPNGELALSVAKRSVAIWVLSPNSAKKTVMKMMK